jgi:hypothetical protein
MGTLTPGATYIYERADGRIYAREFGHTERKLVGYDNQHQGSAERRYLMTEMNSVLTMCEQHPDMKDLLDKLFVLYNLRKTHE